jgi:hypothetical protein
MTPADKAREIRLTDLLRAAPSWTLEQCRQVASVFHWLMAYGEVLPQAQVKETSP